MKLEIFDPGAFSHVRSAPIIRFRTGSGGNTLSPALTSMLKLGGGEHVELAFDPARPKDVYIRKSDTGFKLSKTGDSFHSTSLSKRVFKEAGVDGVAATFRVGEDPVDVEGVKWWPIITANPIKVKTN